MKGLRSGYYQLFDGQHELNIGIISGLSVLVWPLDQPGARDTVHQFVIAVNAPDSDY